MPVAPDPTQRKVTLSANAQPTDWIDQLRQWGLPSSLVSQITQLWMSNPHVTQGQQQNILNSAMRIVRGDPWYAQTFPGIETGIQKGLFADERGYQSYKNDISQQYEQYLHRAVTASEVGRFVRQGVSAQQVGERLNSEALSGTLTDPLKRLFTPAELKALTDQASGISTAAGLRITQEANLAAGVSGLYQDFYGRPVTRAELNNLMRTGQTPERVAQQFQTTANLAAMNPAVSHLFTPQELKQAALQAAGGQTAQGERLQNVMTLATQLNPIFHQYTGQGVSRQEVAQAYARGEDASRIEARLKGRAISGAYGRQEQQVLSTQGPGLLNRNQLQVLGEQQAGYTTPMGYRLQAQLEKAQRRVQTVFQDRLGRATLQLPAGARQRPDVGA